MLLSVSNKNDSPAGPPKLLQVEFYRQTIFQANKMGTDSNKNLFCLIPYRLLHGEQVGLKLFIIIKRIVNFHLVRLTFPYHSQLIYNHEQR